MRSAFARCSPNGRRASCRCAAASRSSPADRVLVVEDVITTGLSTRETVDVATAAGATVVGAATIIDRGNNGASLGLPLYALVELEVPTYQPEACPLCAKGDPVVKPGSRT